MSDPKGTFISNVDTAFHRKVQGYTCFLRAYILCICTIASPAFGMADFLILPNLKAENLILLCTSCTTREMKHEVITLLALSSFVKSFFKSFHIFTVEAAAFFSDLEVSSLKILHFHCHTLQIVWGFFSSLWFGVQIYTIFIIGMYLIFQSSMSIYFQFMISGSGVTL